MFELKITCATAAELARISALIAGVQTADGEAVPPKGKPGRPPKAAKVEAPAEDEDDMLGGDDDEGEADETEEPEEIEEPAPKKKPGRPPAAATAAPTEIDLDKHIVPAFKAYHAANGRDTAKALLAKFKVASVRELKPAQFPKIMQLLKAA